MTNDFDSWSEIYDIIYADFTDDIKFYVEEAVFSNRKVLEIGCGTGRVAIPMAQAGANVTAVDISETMLKTLSRKISPKDISLNPIRMDMRALALPDRFGLIIVPFHGFQSLLHLEDQVECLESLRNHLAHNGTLIINLFVPDRNMLEQEQDKIYFIKDVPLNDDNRSITLWHNSHFDVPNQIITTKLFIDMNESGRIVESQVRDFSLRYIHRYEAEYLFKNSGFELKNLFGDFERNNFGPNSEEMIWELSPK